MSVSNSAVLLLVSLLALTVAAIPAPYFSFSQRQDTPSPDAPLPPDLHPEPASPLMCTGLCAIGEEDGICLWQCPAGDMCGNTKGICLKGTEEVGIVDEGKAEEDADNVETGLA